MSRSGELTGGLPLRRTPIQQPRPRDTGPTPQVRRDVLARDGGCLRCGGLGAGGVQIHHRIARGMGGTDDDRLNQPPNLVSLCPTCHQWVEEHPEQAYLDGWKIRGRRIDPEVIPMRTLQDVWIAVTSDGQIVPHEHEWVSMRTVCERDDPQVCVFCTESRIVVHNEQETPHG